MEIKVEGHAARHCSRWLLHLVYGGHFSFYGAMHKAYGGHVLDGECLAARLDCRREESEPTVFLPAPSVHCNSPSRIILSNRLKGTLNELPAVRVPGGKPPRSCLREDIAATTVQHIPAVDRMRYQPGIRQ